MSTGLYSGTSGLALGVGLYAGNPGLWGGSAGLITGDGASLYLNFLAGAPLDSRVTFTRGSNATLVDRTGKITYAPANLLLQSQTFDNASWVKSAATVTANTTVAPDGTSTADKLTPDVTLASHFAGQTVTTTAVAHTYSAYLKADGYSWAILYASGVNQGVYFDLANGVVGSSFIGAPTSSSITPVGNGWYLCSITFTATTGTAARVYVSPANTVSTFAGDGVSGLFLWGAQLEPVTYQTVPGTYNATTTAAYYGPRFDYDPVTLAPKGLLIEEARTNLLTGSADFTATYWPTATNVVVTADNTTSPDGTSNADRIADNTTAGVQHRLYRDYTFTAAAHTLSVYAKRNDHRWLRLFFFDGTTSFFANFDLLNGATGAKQASATSTITNAGNGWYRCTMTATTAAAVGNVQLVMLPSDDAAVPVLYTGTGTSLWAYGAQLETGAFATSYIPTVASQVTRSADVATMTGTNFSSWYNQSEGTFVTSTSRLSTSALDGISASAYTDANNNIELFARTVDNRLLVFNGGATQVNLIDTGKVSAGVPFATAAAYALNNYALTTNGGAVLTDTSATVPTAIALGIGSRSSNLFYNGHIRQIAYYNTRLPNATLQALTA